MQRVVYILDFGIARKLVSEGHTLKTPRAVVAFKVCSGSHFPLNLCVSGNCTLRVARVPPKHRDELQGRLRIVVLPVDRPHPHRRSSMGKSVMYSSFNVVSSP